MTDYYAQYPKFHVSVDCIIFGFGKGRLHLLLLKRDFEPAKGMWSLMGGFMQEGESADAAARRVLMELTGLDDIYMEQVGAFGAIDRDPGERVISLAYYALARIGRLGEEAVAARNASWVDIDHLPPLVFDHLEMVEKAREIMRRKCVVEPVGLNLLPELFTLTQLQSLYEAIYGEPIDKRNFRRRVAGMDFIERTDMIDKTGSKRGARLYCFNRGAYRKDSRFKL